MLAQAVALHPLAHYLPGFSRVGRGIVPSPEAEARTKVKRQGYNLATSGTSFYLPPSRPHIDPAAPSTGSGRSIFTSQPGAQGGEGVAYPVVVVDQ